MINRGIKTCLGSSVSSLGTPWLYLQYWRPSKTRSLPGSWPESQHLRSSSQHLKAGLPCLPALGTNEWHRPPHNLQAGGRSAFVVQTPHLSVENKYYLLQPLIIFYTVNYITLSICLIKNLIVYCCSIFYRPPTKTLKLKIVGVLKIVVKREWTRFIIWTVSHLKVIQWCVENVITELLEKINANLKFLLEVTQEVKL